MEDIKDIQQINCCVTTPDGTRVLVGGYSGLILVVEVNSSGGLKTVGQFAGHAEEVTSISVSSDGRYAISGSQEEKARIWDIKTGQEIGLIAGFEGPVKAVQFKKNNRQVMATDCEKLIEFDIQKREVVKQRPLCNSWTAQAAAFSPNGALVAVPDSRVIRVWDVDSGRELPPLPTEDMVWSLTFTPDNKHLLSGTTDNINIWNVDDCQRIRVHPSSQGYIKSLAVSSDGSLFSGIASLRDFGVFTMP
jgi:WD40 repeat protein